LGCAGVFLKEWVMAKANSLIPVETIENRIFLLRGQKIMLSQDLAELYNVPVKVLHQAVKRHAARFPLDFMFLLTHQEFVNLKSQFVTSRWGGIRRALPYAFTEQGVAMLSGVLNSPRAIQVNVAVMRAFVRLREVLVIHKELAVKLTELECKLAAHDGQIRAIFEAIRELMDPTHPPSVDNEMGFHVRLAKK
jgi:hypothetical protein